MGKEVGTILHKSLKNCIDMEERSVGGEINCAQISKLLCRISQMILILVFGEGATGATGTLISRQVEDRR